MENEKTFTLLEIEKLIKNAYNVGYCDGLEGGNNAEFREYKDEDDFWDKNKENWLSQEIDLS
ncbi:MAG: hypothetical protein RBR30_01645 [Tenuifilaceae bacterium]|jgi:hypothetical protein|nr:hypothetical protein [Tenuifilaceae bacterium]